MLIDIRGRRKSIYIISFILFGLVTGLAATWHDWQYDTPFLLNLPGQLLGVVFHSLWVRLVSDQIPWVLDIPQVYLLASVFVWGLLGTFLTLVFKPKIILWIVGIYLAVFGGLSISFILMS